MIRNTLRQWLNSIRNILIFRLGHPWVKHGSDVHCQLGVRFSAPHHHIVLGDNVGIGYRCLFQCDAEIGRKVLIASDVAFINSDDHRFHIVGKTMWDSGRGDAYRVIVEDDVWIGHGVIVLSPARIGRGAIVAAGSVVKGDVPRYGIVAGVPARLIRMRFTPEQIDEHETLLIQNGEMTVENRTRQESVQSASHARGGS